MNKHILQAISSRSPGSDRGTGPLDFAGIVNWRVTVYPNQWRPPTDVYETEDRYVIRVEISGMRDGDFSVSMENNLLTIRGNRQEPTDRRSFHQMEIRYGEFLTQVELPFNADMNQVLAEYEDGFLSVILPKSAPRQIPVGD